MDWTSANTEASRLWKKWVSDKPAKGIHNGYTEQEHYQAYDLERIHSCMLQERRYHATGKSNATPAIISEVKGELILLGKIRKALTVGQ